MWLKRRMGDVGIPDRREPQAYAPGEKLREILKKRAETGTGGHLVTLWSVMETTGIYLGGRSRGGTSPGVEMDAQAREGLKAESFGALYHEHYRAIAGLIYRRTGDAHVTEDLTSDVFASAFGAMHTYRGDVPVISWLRAIAQNRVNRWAKREAGFRGILRRIPIVRDFVPTPEMKNERMPALEALLRLPPGQQEVLSSHYLEHMSLEEVGVMLGVSAEAVKSRLARARQSLRREMERGEQRVPEREEKP